MSAREQVRIPFVRHSPSHLACTLDMVFLARTPRIIVQVLGREVLELGQVRMQMMVLALGLLAPV